MDGCVCLGFRGDVPEEKRGLGGGEGGDVGGNVQIIFLSSANIASLLYSSLSQLPSHFRAR